MARKHQHYFKDVRHLQELDVYRVLALFNVTDQAFGHAIKKLLVAGGRGAGKDVSKDIQEAIDTLHRWQEMREEDGAGVVSVSGNSTTPCSCPIGYCDIERPELGTALAPHVHCILKQIKVNR